MKTAIFQSPAKMIEQLQTEAKSNKALNAVCHVFALRERARQQVTFAALKQTMIKEGFSFKDNEYEKVLRLLGTSGLGRLEFDSKGRVKALKDIKVTLQSLGKAIVEKGEMQRFAPRNKYSDVPVMPSTPPPERSAPQQLISDFQMPVEDVNKAPIIQTVKFATQMVQSVALTAIINGMPAVFVLSDEMDSRTFGRLLAKSYGEELTEIKG